MKRKLDVYVQKTFDETYLLNFKDMKVGRYDQQIEFWSEGMVSDGYGGYTPNPLLELKTWARIEQLKVSANIEQAQMQLPTVYRVGIMLRAGFMPSVQHLVKWREKNYRIKANYLFLETANRMKKMLKWLD